MVSRACRAVPLLIRTPFCCANWRGVHCSRTDAVVALKLVSTNQGQPNDTAPDPYQGNKPTFTRQPSVTRQAVSPGKGEHGRDTEG